MTKKSRPKFADLAESREVGGKRGTPGAGANERSQARHSSLLDPRRPSAYCPGCSHEASLHALDRALSLLGLSGSEVAIVSDIGCSGLFDTFFQTHAFHGLHGRALTYAAGIKLARPRLKVIVTMGDGGLGIGGAHLLAACRRNLDLTLLVLNNFNFGMTGGQFSAATPESAMVASGFLNALERPMDACSVVAAAGAPFAARASVYEKNLDRILAEAIAFEGFSVVEIRGACTGHFLKKNALSPRDIEQGMAELTPFKGTVKANLRREYGGHYREKSAESKVSGSQWRSVDPAFPPPVREREEIVLLGTAGEGIVSAGAVLAHAAILAGMRATQKNDHNITVMRGPSVSEIILSPDAIGFTGVERPDVIIALSPEGVSRRKDLFPNISKDGLVILEMGVEVPPTHARRVEMDFKAQGLRKREKAIAALALLAEMEDYLTPEMLRGALTLVYSGGALASAFDVLERAEGATQTQ